MGLSFFCPDLISEGFCSDYRLIIHKNIYIEKNTSGIHIDDR